MDDVAGAVAEDRVVLVLAVHREATRATLFQAVKLFVPEVPASRTLVQVPTDGADIADLRGPDLRSGLGQRRIQARRFGVLGELGERDGGANPQTAVRRLGEWCDPAPLTFTSRSGCAM